MNKLLVEKRYNDVLRVFKKIVKDYEATFEASKVSKDRVPLYFPFSSVKLVSEALLHMVSSIYDENYSNFSF
jgi:hypothetical protein